MSKTDQRRERVAKRIAASQQRLERDNGKVLAKTRRDPLPDSSPPENYRSLAKEYPWLAMAAGVGVGVLIAALLPRNFAGKVGRRALGVATIASELGLAYSKQARDVAGEAAHDGLAKLDDTTAPLRQRANRVGMNARSQGMRLAGEAMKLASRLRN